MARADGRYALRRWEVNLERADEWGRAAEVAAARGNLGEAGSAAHRQQACTDLAAEFRARYLSAARRVRRLTAGSGGIHVLDTPFTSRNAWRNHRDA
jgi:hypothetical protein